jgi:hypothetical protein
LDEALSEAARLRSRRKRLVTGADAEVVVADEKYCHGTDASFAILHIFEAWFTERARCRQ